MLVLDPHQPSRQVLLYYLQQHNMAGCEAATLDEAKARFNEFLIQAVAFQCPLPDVAFLDVVDWLCHSPPEGRQLYVLAITSMPEVYTPHVLLQEGANDCLAKPVSGDDVREAFSRMRSALKLNCS